MALHGKRRFFVLILLTGLAALFAGCAAAPKAKQETSAGKTYSNAEHGFSMIFPETWEFKEGMQGTIVVGLSPKENDSDNIRENVNVLTDKLPVAGITLGEYMKAADAGIASQTSEYVKLGSGNAVIDGGEAGWMLYTHVYGGAEYKALIYVIIRGTKAFVVTCTATPDSYAGYDGVFRTIAESLKFAK